jgi:membrane protease YdiL (CAAX protease family)
MVQPNPSSGEYPGIGQALILLLLLLVVEVVAITVIGLGLALAGLSSIPDSAVAALDVVVSAGVLWWALRKTQKRFREVFRFSAFRPILLFPLILVVVGLSILLSEADNVTRRLVPAPEFLTELMRDVVRGGVGFVNLAVIAPVKEELLFRGLILGGFLWRYGIRKAIMVSAAIFALFHLNPYQFLSAFAIGLFLAWLFCRTRSLWPCLVTHGLYNGLAWLAANVWQFDIPGYTVDVTDPAALSTAEFQPLWFDLLGGLALAVGLILLVRVPSLSAKSPAPPGGPPA